jgi:hypothetical protein
VFLLGAVDQDAYADNLTVMPADQLQDLADRLAGGKYVVDDKDFLTGIDAEAPPERPFVITFPFSEYTARLHLSGYLMGEDDTAGGRSGYHINFMLGEVGANKAAKLFGVVGELQYAELLPVDRGVQPGGEQEVPFQYRPRFAEDSLYVTADCPDLQTD